MLFSEDKESVVQGMSLVEQSMQFYDGVCTFLKDDGNSWTLKDFVELAFRLKSCEWQRTGDAFGGGFGRDVCWSV